MDNFIVSARKYRPTTFNTVVGQSHITNTLKNAIKNNQLAQAFLFCGPRGVGKTTCARVLAKTINCQNITTDTEACGTCDSCKSFLQGASMNFHELDAASNNSVDDIRSLVEQVRYAPQSGKYKIYIIDEVHMLSTSAFNAFLKTLEEPPPYAIFILATTEKHKILPTILSRCQIFDFNRIKVNDIAEHLSFISGEENIQAEMDALHIIAQKADGALRDALSMFDQITSFSGGNISYQTVIDNLNILDYDYYFKATDLLVNQHLPESLLLFNTVLENGFDGNNYMNGLCEHFRNLLVSKDPSTIKLLETSEGIKKRYLEQSQKTDVSFLLSALSIGNQCDLNLKTSKNQRLQVELALIKMCHISSVLNSTNTSGSAPQEIKKKPELKATEPAKIAEVQTKAIEKVVISTEKDTKKVASSTSIKIPGIPKTPVISYSLPVEKSEVSDLDIQSAKEKRPKEEFDLDRLREVWSELKLWAKTQKSTNLYTALGDDLSLKENFLILLQVENNYQSQLINDERQEILTFLRHQLNNFYIDLEINETAIIDTKKRLYTNSDKFKYMAEKNPHLMDMLKKLDLDLD